jgi:hypothetical protein
VPTALAVRQVNNLPMGYRISYRPIDLPADLKKVAKLTLVMVPESPDGQVTVLETKLAAAAGEWTVPFPSRILLLVFAPQGLDEKRLTNLVTKDEALVATLADYADETADIEAQLENATELAQEADENETQPARPSTPAEQALFALVRAVNPAVSGYDPLGVGRRVGPQTTMGKGEDAFFDNAGGLVPGGGMSGVAAPELPRPIAGEGAKQTLRIAMPWPSPSPKAPLFVWLRGETAGRATTVRP